jgi:Mrp family chromosome partitioning ATPase
LAEDAIVTTRVANLSMLPRGGPKSNAAELLASPALRHTLDYAVSQFDYVILDSPPVLEVTDAVAIAQHAHGVLLCLGLTKDARISTQRARDQLVDNGADILGLVVNNFGGFRWELGPEQSYRRDAAYTRPTRRDGKPVAFSSATTQERLNNGEN